MKDILGDTTAEGRETPLACSGVPSAFRKNLCSQAPHHHRRWKATGTAAPWQRSCEVPGCSEGAGAWTHPYPAMVSIPFPAFFPNSISCILLFFSQKALILLWAGNTLDLCVTANYHGNRRESRLHRSFSHPLLLPRPATSGAILAGGQENRRFSRRFLKKKQNHSSHPQAPICSRAERRFSKPFDQGRRRRFLVLPQATANAQSSTRPRSQAGNTKSRSDAAVPK